MTPIYRLAPTPYGSSFRKPSPTMAHFAREQGFDISHYVGDLSGLRSYADGQDSDRTFAQNAGLQYIDVRDFIQQNLPDDKEGDRIEAGGMTWEYSQHPDCEHGNLAWWLIITRSIDEKLVWD